MLQLLIMRLSKVSKVSYFIRLSCTILILISSTAQATNGYFQIGYGAESIAMGGTAVALPGSGMVLATNPTAMTHSPQGWQIGLRWFNPDRDARLDCSGVFACDRSLESKSSSRHFFIPEASYIRSLNQNWTMGIAAYGNGGMNTDYSRNIIDQAFAATAAAPVNTGTGYPDTAGSLGVDLAQLIFAPSIAYKVNGNNSFGVSLLMAAQRFQSEGLVIFAGLSSDPTNLTNRNHDMSYGLGIKIGWFSQPHPQFSWGISYSSKVYMSEFDSYSGLFAEQGDFDIPASLVIGFAFKPTNKLTIAMDAQRIFYSKIKAINISGPTEVELAGVIDQNRQLGAAQGIGFGWETINVYKLGMSYALDNHWVLRAVYNHNQSPINNKEVLINILSPGIVTDHVTLGVSYKINTDTTINLAYMHAFDASQKDNSTAFFGSRASVRMNQNSLNISFSKTY
ncbi:MAG: OmpP1/FadL family transporter [Gammaproteobacteria bacterium]